LKLWNYISTSADLLKHIVQGQFCKAQHLVGWTTAVLQHPQLATFLPERRSTWAEDLFVFGHEMVPWPSNCPRCRSRFFVLFCHYLSGCGLAEHLELLLLLASRQPQSHH
jgi:hypothetical protein